MTMGATEVGVVAPAGEVRTAPVVAGVVQAAENAGAALLSAERVAVELQVVMWPGGLVEALAAEAAAEAAAVAAVAAVVAVGAAAAGSERGVQCRRC